MFVLASIVSFVPALMNLRYLGHSSTMPATFADGVNEVSTLRVLEVLVRVVEVISTFVPLKSRVLEEENITHDISVNKISVRIVPDTLESLFLICTFSVRAEERFLFENTITKLSVVLVSEYTGELLLTEVTYAVGIVIQTL